jgi:putative FmdB family regulatory protein
MPLYEYVCYECEEIVEKLLPVIECDWPTKCEKCKNTMSKIPSTFRFELKYNNKTDCCDWSGNSSMYWDEYKKQKAEGKNVVVPEG